MRTFEEMDKSTEEVAEILRCALENTGEFDTVFACQYYDNEVTARLNNGRLIVFNFTVTQDVDEQVLDDYNECEEEQ